MMFGGYSSLGTANFKRFSNQTWYWSEPANRWVQVVTPFASTPWHRASSCMVNVPFLGARLGGGGGLEGGYVMMFSGKDNFTAAGSSFLNDTWRYVSGAWTNVTAFVGTQPTARMGATCMWDAVDQKVVLFGGWDATNSVRNDTWYFDPTLGTVVGTTVSGQWVKVSSNGAAGQPNPRGWAAGSWDTQYGADVLFSGGFGPQGAVKNRTADTWAFTGGSWTNVTTTVNPLHGTSGVPPGGWQDAMVDTPWQYVLLFGGENANSAVSNAVYALGISVTDNIADQPGEMMKGSAVKFWDNATGGTGAGSYTYSYSGLPPGCLSQNLSVLSCTPTQGGVYVVSASATDASGATANALNPVKLVVDTVNWASGALTTGGQVNSVTPSFLIASVWSNMSGTYTTAHALAADINATPFRHIKFYGQFDKANVTAGCQYTSSGQCNPLTFSLTGYKNLCAFTKSYCSLGLPAQINNPGAAANTAKFVVVTNGWAVPVWEIGVEPISWNHWGIPYGSWALTDNSVPNATQFATEVKNYVNAVLSVEPTAQFTTPQLPMSYANNLEPWFVTVGQTACALPGHPVIAGGDDSYPLKKTGTSVNLANFYSNLSVVPTVVSRVVVNQTAGCPSAPEQQWVMETQAGQTKAPAAWVPYMTGFPDVAWQAWTLAAVLKAGAQGFDPWIFAQDNNGENGWWDSLVNTSTGVPKPAYSLYSTLITHLPFSAVYAANVTTTMNGTMAVGAANSTERAWLVANSNTTVSLKLTLPTILTAGVVIADDPANGTQVHYYAAGSMPATWTLPAMGVLLVQANQSGGPGGGAPTASATGLALAAVGALAAVVLIAAVSSKSRGGRGKWRL